MIDPELGIEAYASETFTFDEGTLTIEAFDRIIRPGPDAGIYAMVRFTASGLEPTKYKVGIISEVQWFTDIDYAVELLERYHINEALPQRVMASLFLAYQQPIPGFDE